MRNLTQFHRKLHRWYQTHGRRDLPWRNTRDAYHIYLSEVMLQQTQVKTVLERFYFQFLERFPTLQSLAKASQDEVLSAWQGLGYYSRAINLQKAAQQIVEARGQRLQAGAKEDRALCQHSSCLMPIASCLMTLPGIGRNTAHAIAAFAYHHPAPVMEANVKRVLCRIFALENPSERQLWEYANQLLDTKNPFDYNQAMMDIGATICTKRNPDCPACPAFDICEGKISPEKYPAKMAKKKVPVRTQIIVVEHDGTGYFHATPRKTRFLYGLYHFTEVESAPKGAKLLGHISQSYSHFTLEADIYLHLIKRDKSNRWFSKKELRALPMSMAEKKILQLLG